MEKGIIWNDVRNKIVTSKEVCTNKTLIEIEIFITKINCRIHIKIFQRKSKKINSYLKNDKKNDDDKINFILLKKLEKLLFQIK